MMDKSQWQKVLDEWLGPGTTVLGIELLREWSQSRVVRIKAQVNGDDLVIFAKQAHVGLDTEIAVYSLAAEARAFPAPAGTRVHVDGVQWLLLNEAQGIRLANSTPDNYLLAAQFLADFHEQAVQSGWPDKANFARDLHSRIATLAEQVIEQVRELVSTGQFTGVDLELVQAAQHVLALQGPELIKRLSLFPTTLIHGDCHSGNIFLTNDGIQLVDWGSAMVAPGLLDIVGLVDVAERMHERAGDLEASVSAYWAKLSVATRSAYGNFGDAWKVMRVVRALLELEWFVKTADDYGTRANRELLIIRSAGEAWGTVLFASQTP